MVDISTGHTQHVHKDASCKQAPVSCHYDQALAIQLSDRLPVVLPLSEGLDRNHGRAQLHLPLVLSATVGEHPHRQGQEQYDGL